MENKRPIIIAAVCLGLLGFLSVPLMKAAYDKIYTNGEKIAVLESEVRGFERRFQSLDNGLKSINTKLDQLIPDVASIKAKVDNLERANP